ncbi:MAG: putative quinol monooxygenase [Microcystis sp.]
MNRFYGLTALLLTVVLSQATAQSTYVRIAKLVVDSIHLADYTAALQEEIESAVRVESGVLSMYAVANKNQPHHLTIIETYASRAAYEQHIQTPHFQKYKTGTLA